MNQPLRARAEPESETSRGERAGYWLRFGDFELDVASGELHRDGEVVTVQPQPAKVLLYLAERSGEVVSRRQLQQHVWGEGHHVDYEQGLNYCIKAVRRILGDQAGDPRFIETIPRRGYRFLVPVEKTHGARRPRASAAHEVPARSWWPPAPAAPALLAALVVLAVTAGLILGLGAGSAEPERLAVLPFQDFAGVDESLRMGLMDELISRLSRDYPGELAVIARASSARYAEDPRGAAAVGRELDVDYLLTGAIQGVDSGDRVSVQLVRAADETNLWATVLERRPGDGDWGEWSRRVTREVGLALELENAGASEMPTLPPELFTTYLRGLYLSSSESSEGRAEALEAMELVLESEPDFTPALLVRSRLLQERLPPLEFAPRVERSLRRVTEIDPGSAEGWIELARLRLLYLRDWSGAAASVERALEHNPRLARAHHVRAMVLSAVGRHDEAAAAMRRALVSDPFSPELTSHQGWARFLARRYEEAIEHSRYALEIEPGSTSARACILYSAVELGDEELALAQAEALAGRPVGDLDDYWRASFEGYRARSVERGFTLGMQAVPLSYLGDHRSAVETLQRACDEGSAWPIAFVLVDPRLDPLRDQPGFDRVVRCAGYGGHAAGRRPGAGSDSSR